MTRIGVARVLRRWWPVAIGAVPGAWLGWQAAYSASLGGMAQLGAVVLLMLVGGILVAGALIGTALRLWSRAAGVGMAVQQVTAGLLVALVVAAPGSVLLGLTYRAPVHLEATGTAGLTLAPSGGSMAFTPNPRASVSCTSVADGTGTWMVSARALGDAVVDGQGVVIGGRVGMEEANQALGGAETRIEIWVDALGLPDGAPRPAWTGFAYVQSVPIAGSAGGGSVAFTSLQLTSASPDATVPPDQGWPPSIAGTLTWTCGAWADPGSEGDPKGIASPGAASMIFTPSGVAMETSSTTSVTCLPDSDGTLTSVTAENLGTLLGWPLAVEIELGGASANGPAPVTLHAQMGKTLPEGFRYAPAWQGSSRVTELGPGDRTGVVTFTNLPTPVDPTTSYPPGWPATMSGTITWSCGG